MVKSSHSARPRRLGCVWTTQDDPRSELRPAPFDGCPSKSIMKVATLEDSLRFCAKMRLVQENEGKIYPDEVGEVGEKRSSELRFGRLQFREYKITAVDNPETKQGPALGIDWEFEDLDWEPTMDEYENKRAPPRSLREMKLSRHERERRLMETGFSRKELDEVASAIQEARRKRKKTLKNMSIFAETALEKRQTLLRDVRIHLHLRKNEAAEVDSLWDQAQQA